MPRTIVGYEVEGRLRRPIYRDEVIDPGPLAGLPVGSPEAAAAIARVAAAASPGDPHMAKSRRNGTRRHFAVMAERRGKEEDPVRNEPSEDMHETIPDTLRDDPSPLERLAEAAAWADTAHRAKVAADEAWDIARDALEVAWATVRHEGIAGAAPLYTLNLPPREDVDAATVEVVVEQTAVEDVVDAETERAEARRRAATLTAQHVDRALFFESVTLTDRQRRVLDLFAEFRDRKRVAAILGIRYQSVDGVLKAICARGLMPAELYADLPARFATYARAAR